MRISGGRLRLGLFAAVFVLLCVNALALWGEQTAMWGFTALQAITGLGGHRVRRGGRAPETGSGSGLAAPGRDGLREFAGG